MHLYVQRIEKRIILYFQGFIVYYFRLLYPGVKILKMRDVLVLVDVSVFVEKDPSINSSKTQLYLQIAKNYNYLLNVCWVMGE